MEREEKEIVPDDTVRVCMECDKCWRPILEGGWICAGWESIEENTDNSYSPYEKITVFRNPKVQWGKCLECDRRYCTECVGAMTNKRKNLIVCDECTAHGR